MRVHELPADTLNLGIPNDAVSRPVNADPVMRRDVRVLSEVVPVERGHVPPVGQLLRSERLEVTNRVPLCGSVAYFVAQNLIAVGVRHRDRRNDHAGGSELPTYGPSHAVPP